MSWVLWALGVVVGLCGLALGFGFWLQWSRRRQTRPLDSVSEDWLSEHRQDRS